MIGQLHLQLKEATAPIHRQLDAQSIFTALTAGDLDVETYRQVMLQHWLAYRSWQPQLDRAFAAMQLDASWRIDLAVEQLELDCPDEEKAVLQLKAPKPLPLALDGAAEYLGCAYVFAGSRLGGRFILRALQSRRSTLSVDRFHYYETLGHKQTSTWPAWVQQLEDYAIASELEFGQIIAGAVDCFEVLTDWFKEPRVALGRTLLAVQ